MNILWTLNEGVISCSSLIHEIFHYPLVMTRCLFCSHSGFTPLPSSALSWTEFSWKPPHTCFLGSLCVSAVYCHYSHTGVSFSRLLHLLWKYLKGNILLFMLFILFWRLSWYNGMGAEYNMGLEIYFIPRYWSWLNPSQCREELISLAGLIIYFILAHKKWLSNILLHLGTAQK